MLEYMKMNSKIYEQRAAIAGVLAHPMRLMLLDYLSEQGETCVHDLVDFFCCKQPVMSKHLNILKNIGLLGIRKAGLKVFYSLKSPCIMSFFDCADKAIKSHKESL